MTKHFIIGSLAFATLLSFSAPKAEAVIAVHPGFSGSIASHAAFGFHQLAPEHGGLMFHEDDINFKRPEARPMGSIGGGKKITGYDEMGKPVVKSCFPYTSC